MFFSLMSAFNIGFRDANFGRWLELLTQRECDLKAVGWARTATGFQSVASVYLIALWVLTYFGRPPWIEINGTFGHQPDARS
jgi:hypothetical protein